MEASWTKINSFAVGGLREMGFYKDTNFLMVMSNDRGIFDCFKGEKVGRDYSDYYSEKWNSDTGMVDGFDFMVGERVHCGGFEHPDVLRKTTKDNWKTIVKNDKRPDYRDQLVDGEIMFLINENTREEIELMTFLYGIDRGYGFSNNNNCFVIATSSDLHIWKRT